MQSLEKTSLRFSPHSQMDRIAELTSSLISWLNIFSTLYFGNLLAPASDVIRLSARIARVYRGSVNFGELFRRCIFSDVVSVSASGSRLHPGNLRPSIKHRPLSLPIPFIDCYFALLLRAMQLNERVEVFRPKVPDFIKF